MQAKGCRALFTAEYCIRRGMAGKSSGAHGRRRKRAVKSRCRGFHLKYSIRCRRGKGLLCWWPMSGTMRSACRAAGSARRTQGFSACFRSRCAPCNRPLRRRCSVDGEGIRIRAATSCGPNVCRNRAYHFTVSARITPSAASSAANVSLRYWMQSITSGSVLWLRTERLPAGDTRTTLPSDTGKTRPST